MAAKNEFFILCLARKTITTSNTNRTRASDASRTALSYRFFILLVLPLDSFYKIPAVVRVVTWQGLYRFPGDPRKHEVIYVVTWWLLAWVEECQLFQKLDQGEVLAHVQLLSMIFRPYLVDQK